MKSIPHTASWSLIASLLCASGACYKAELKSASEREGTTVGIDSEVPDAGSEPDTFGLKHSDCSLPAPKKLPKLSAIDEVAFEQEVNAWKQEPCDATTAQPTCGAFSACESPNPICFRADGDEASPGICGEDTRGSDDASLTTMTYRDGRCVVHVRPRDKAAACCSRLAGFDCRTYPFETESKPGERCAKHSDCEAGLLCSEAGVCACPGAVVAVDEAICFPEYPPLPWQGEPLPDGPRGTCTAALNGYQAEVLDTGDNQFARVAVAPDGSIHVVYTHFDDTGGRVRHGTNATGAWVMSDLDLPAEPGRGDVPYEPAQLVIDSDGFLHLALGIHGVQYATNRSGTWTVTHLVGAEEIAEASLALASDGTPRLAYALLTGGLYLATPKDSGLNARLVSQALVGQATRVKLILARDDYTQILVDADEAWNFGVTPSGVSVDIVSPYVHLDAVQAGETVIVMASRRSPDPRVVLGGLAATTLTALGDAPDPFLVWQQDASRYKRDAPSINVAIGPGGLIGTHTTPQGRQLFFGQLDKADALQITTDLSPAELVVDGDSLAQVFIAGGRSLFRLSTTPCP